MVSHLKSRGLSLKCARLRVERLHDYDMLLHVMFICLSCLFVCLICLRQLRATGRFDWRDRRLSFPHITWLCLHAHLSWLCLYGELRHAAIPAAGCCLCLIEVTDLSIGMPARGYFASPLHTWLFSICAYMMLHGLGAASLSDMISMFQLLKVREISYLYLLKLVSNKFTWIRVLDNVQN